MREPEITEELIREHGLTAAEYARVLDILGRPPTFTELGIFSVMWSEHCSYKSSRIHFRNFPMSAPWVVQGPGENAGIIDIGSGLCAVFKMESHNHPSFIEPYQGAATGVGGILRDIFTMGARPVASLNSLRFGSLDDPLQRHLLSGVVSGIAGYGNCIGVPTVGGDVYFHPCYAGNILVNVFSLGIVKREKIFRGSASGAGNPVIYVGSKTGRDGIHGVTMASEEFTDDADQKKPNVQVGDPFTEKLLLEACLEAMDRDLIVGIQDMGGAGLTSSSSEMAGRAGTGIELHIEKIPPREKDMIPYEFMLSESQERMLIVVKKGREGELLEIFRKWDLEAVVVGQVTDDGFLSVLWNGGTVARIPASKISSEAPLYDRPYERPPWQDGLQRLDHRSIGLPTDYNEVLIRLLSAPNIASKRKIWQQYDHMVRTNTVVLPGSDAAVIRVKGGLVKGRENDEGLETGIAMSVDCSSRYCLLDPHLGGMHAVAEAARNIACCGAVPRAVTDNLNFGNPEKPEVMWQFVNAVKGIGEACRALETPVVSGNVSFYNETKGTAIHPTPTIGMVGILDDVRRHLTQAFKFEGDIVLLLGTTKEELGGSEYLAVIHGIERGMPPSLDLDAEKRLHGLLFEAVPFLHSAHDCSEGGLAVALAESAIAGGIGADLSLKRLPRYPIDYPVEGGGTAEGAGPIRKDALFFGESAGRVVVSLEECNLEAVKILAGKWRLPLFELGGTGGGRFRIDGEIDLPVDDLSTAFNDSLMRYVAGRNG
ncbi:MAG: phosphoribosylformylglycinamidine synthase subunit PurL [Nitrospiraceae bacterium]|nr:phosphoribosylformylglycinamidine synthase subunit PurL [Nitrospiraceae bacterium]